MNKTVMHLTRLFLPSTASFIRNQVLSHVRFIPKMIFKEYLDCDHAREVLKDCESLDLEKNKTGWERLYSLMIYQRFRFLTGRDVRISLDFIRRTRARLLHIHFGTDAGMFCRVIEKSGLPAVVSFYGYDCTSFPRRLWGYGKRYLQKRVFPQAAKILAMSPDMRDDLIQLGCPEDKIITHYHGSDTCRFSFKRDYGEKEKIRLLMLAKLDPKKGHLFLLSALRKIPAALRNKITLQIVGDGWILDQLKEYVSAYHLQNVFFQGFIPYHSDQHQDLFRNVDIFVHPSVTSPAGDKEGIPGAIVEAMASGLPVISTFHAGIPFVVQNWETGILVKEWDTEGLSEALIKLIESPDLREQIGKKASRYAVENLDLHIRQKQLERIYESLI